VKGNARRPERLRGRHLGPRDRAGPRLAPRLAEHPDIGTVLAMRGPGDGWAFPADSAGDFADLVRRALEADSA
jgi:hypothetical protein